MASRLRRQLAARDWVVCRKAILGPVRRVLAAGRWSDGCGIAELQARARHSHWVGSASSADRTADVPPASDVDQDRETVTDCFGGCSRSSGRRPMAAVLWNLSLTRRFPDRSYDRSWPSRYGRRPAANASQRRGAVIDISIGAGDRDRGVIRPSRARAAQSSGAWAVCNLVCGCRPIRRLSRR